MTSQMVAILAPHPPESFPSPMVLAAVAHTLGTLDIVEYGPSVKQKR